MAYHLSDEDWEEIRAISRNRGGRGLKMHCCNVRAVPKHTPGGKRRYFAHFGKAEACEWVGETEAHIEAKMAALAAASALGWTADAEVTRAAWLDREPDLKACLGGCEAGRSWEADVLAIRGGKLKVRVAIEIQRSGQGRSETHYRDERYTKDGILPFWVFFSRFAASKQDTRWKVVLAQLRQRRRSVPSTALGLPIVPAMAEAEEAVAGVREADLRAHATSTFSGEIDPTEWLCQPHKALGCVDIQDSHGLKNLIQTPFLEGGLNEPGSPDLERSPVGTDGTALARQA